MALDGRVKRSRLHGAELGSFIGRTVLMTPGGERRALQGGSAIPSLEAAKDG